MEVLELPLEAVVVGGGRHSIIAIPSIWTCLALLAASCIGFYWRVSAVNSSSSASSFFSHPITVASLKQQPEEEKEEGEEGQELEQQVVSSSTPTLAILPTRFGGLISTDSVMGRLKRRGSTTITMTTRKGRNGMKSRELWLVGRRKRRGLLEVWNGIIIEISHGRARFLDMTAINGSVVKLRD